jgi:hypothetical protein
VLSTETDPEGRFVFPGLRPGAYTIRVAKPGFALSVTEGVGITVGSSPDLVVTLRVGPVADAVVVQAELGRGDAATVAQTIEALQIEALPINGRNFIAFSLLTPGVTTDRTPQQGVSQNSGLTFVGQHARSNNITVDGLDNNELMIGAVRENFGQEAIREFQVLPVGYPAEFGNASGGVVNIVTKSGTNTPTGTLFGYFRDDALNAKEYFEKHDARGNAVDRAKSPYAQKQFGGTFGGPLRANRSFFFAAAERLDVTANNAVTIDETTAVTHPFTGLSLGTPADLLRAAGFPIETGHVPFDVRSTHMMLKFDHTLTPGHFVTIRGNRTHVLNENIEPFGGILARSRAGAAEATYRVIAASLATSISRRVFNELRVQFSDQDFLLRALDPRCGGACVREDQGGPTVEITGIASVGRHRIAPNSRDATRIQIADTFSYFHGPHQFKAGVDFNSVRLLKYSVPLNFGGRFVFAPLPAVQGLLPSPVSAIQAFALGLPAAYVQGYGNSSIAFVYRDVALFGQDQWQLTTRLSAQLGVRYQRQFWPTDSFRVPGYPGSYEFPQDRNDVAPRLSVIWQPTADGGTSIRGSYGVFYEHTFGALRAVPSIVDGEDGVRTLAQRFPAAVSAWNAPGRRLAEPASSYPSVRITIDPKLRTPYAHHFVAGVEHQLWNGSVLAADLVTTRGYNLVGTIDLNPVVPSLGPGRRPEDIGGVAGTSASVLQYSGFGETWYRGLLTSWRHRFGQRRHLLASYTWSKAEDTATDFQSAFIVQDSGGGRNPADPGGLPVGFNPRTEKGPANHDQRHRFVVSGTSEVPGGFEAAAILTVGSGRPYNVLAGTDLNGDGDGGSFPSDRARRVPGDPTTSVARNSGTTPGQAGLDLRISRAFLLRGGWDADVILEIFNAFNRTNFTDVNNVFGTGSYPTNPLPTFGLHHQAASARQVQLGARLTF